MKKEEKLPRIDRTIEMNLFNIYEYASRLKHYPFPLGDLYCFYLLVEKYITLKTSTINGHKDAQNVIKYIKVLYPRIREQLHFIVITAVERNVEEGAFYVKNRLDNLTFDGGK